MFCKKFFVTLLAAAVFVSSTCAAAKTEVIEIENVVPEIGVHQNVTFAQYFTWPESRLQMDIYMPAVKGKVPAVIFAPGGWWLTAPKVAGTQICYQLAQAGFVAATIDYRTIGTVNYIEAIGDVKAAVRYLRANADKFNIDKNKIAVMGMSAGGYLATMVGVTGGVEKFNFGDYLNERVDVQAVVDIFGPTDLTKVAADYPKAKQDMYYSPGAPPALFVNGVPCYKDSKGGSLLDTPDTARDSNPLTYIDKNTSPFLIMHGNADKTISPSQSKLLHDALIKNGVDSTHYIINGGDHAAFYFYQPKTFGIIVDFLNRTLR